MASERDKCPVSGEQPCHHIKLMAQENTARDTVMNMQFVEIKEELQAGKLRFAKVEERQQEIYDTLLSIKGMVSGIGISTNFVKWAIGTMFGAIATGLTIYKMLG